MLLLGCGNADPVEPDENPVRARPSGVGGGTGGAGSLIGTWQTVVIVQVPGDIQTWTTTWGFDPDGLCRQTIETESLAEGFPRTTFRRCTYVAGDFDITIDFEGGGSLTFEFSFAQFSPDRLVLDGFEYERIT